VLVLGIETSCDETGIGLVNDGRVVANAVASQVEVHAPFGGVVPERASRAHLETIEAVLERALQEAGATLPDVDAFAVCSGPGLIGALLVGVAYGKALALARGKACVAINHLEGHLATVSEGGTEPLLALLVSGGHTLLVHVPEPRRYRVLGGTRDDAAGEAFDKVARLLGLPYPGGPYLSRLAAEGDASRVSLGLPLSGQTGYEFSFSGLKTQISRLLQAGRHRPADIAAAFERVVVTTLVKTTVRAARDLGLRRVGVAGGVAANAALRAAFAAAPVDATFPAAALNTDNGAMIALAAHQRLTAGEWTPAVDAAAALPLATP
jgi:N6-L-threonylcarbamoyladenine synthase